MINFRIFDFALKIVIYFHEIKYFRNCIKRLQKPDIIMYKFEMKENTATECDRYRLSSGGLCYLYVGRGNEAIFYYLHVSMFMALHNKDT